MIYRSIILALFMLSACGRSYVKHKDLDPAKCDQKAMSAALKINEKIKWLKTHDALKIIVADRKCIAYIESINDHNRKGAKINRPDNFMEDLQEFSTGGLFGLLIGIALML